MTESPVASKHPALDGEHRRQSVQGTVRLRRAIAHLASSMPFYAELMSAWTARADDGIGTCGVGWECGALQLRYSPIWLSELSVPEICGVLVHECLHVVLGHVDIVPDNTTDLRALHIATETTVNEFVRGFPLPGKPMLLEHYPDLAPLQSTRERYEILACPSPAGGSNDASAVSSLADRNAGGGEAEGGRGTAPADEPNGDCDTLDSHAGWESIRRAGSVARLAVAVAKERAARKHGHLLAPEVAQVMGRASIGVGNVAGSKRERLRSTDRAWLDWRRLLAHLPLSRQIPEETVSRPPRRQPDLVGIVPGRRHVSKPPILLVALDVSSSMSPTILGWIKHEVRSLASMYRVALVEVDVLVQHAQLLFEGLDRHPSLIDDEARGRGGTCFDAAFSPDVIAWAGGGEEEIDAVLYFTDGFGPPPTTVCPVPLLWILADEHDRVRVPATWGMVVGTDGEIVRGG